MPSLAKRTHTNAYEWTQRERSKDGLAILMSNGLTLVDILVIITVARMGMIQLFLYCPNYYLSL